LGTEKEGGDRSEKKKKKGPGLNRERGKRKKTHFLTNKEGCAPCKPSSQKEGVFLFAINGRKGLAAFSCEGERSRQSPFRKFFPLKKKKNSQLLKGDRASSEKRDRGREAFWI